MRRLVRQEKAVFEADVSIGEGVTLKRRTVGIEAERRGGSSMGWCGRGAAATARRRMGYRTCLALPFWVTACGLVVAREGSASPHSSAPYKPAVRACAAQTYTPSQMQLNAVQLGHGLSAGVTLAPLFAQTAQGSCVHNRVCHHLRRRRFVYTATAARRTTLSSSTCRVVLTTS